MKITFLEADGCFSSGITGLLDMFSIANLWQTFLTGRPEPLFETEIVPPLEAGPSSAAAKLRPCREIERR